MQVFNLHGHEETSTTGHDHGHAEEEEENQEFIWKSCVVLLGIYGFFLFELFIHAITRHLTKVFTFQSQCSPIFCTCMLQHDA